MKCTLATLLLLIGLPALCQMSGNSAYNQSEKVFHKNVNMLYLGDSAFLIEADILLNTPAESYVAIFGVSQEGKTLQECNTLIDKRIQGFVAELGKIGIPKNDVYIDITTQNKIFDYKIQGNVAEEYLQGFELKKTVNLRFKDISQIDKLMITASQFEIYDLVKVDYIISDIQKIYSQLFAEATTIINRKKELYLNLTHVTLLPVSQIYGEEFLSLYPNDRYKSYQAFESGRIERDYESRLSIKNIRKSATFYYDKPDESGFDKVINPMVIEPAISFVLRLKVKYTIDKTKKK
jgi:hypothetical protein